MANILTIRISPENLARLDRRAAACGQDRSGYVRRLIEQDLKSPEPRKHKFASADLVGAYRTGLKTGDNATVRRVIRERLGQN